MKIERIDHVHVSPENFDDAVSAFEKFIGHDLLMKMKMDQYGTEVGYEPFPYGVEFFRPYDTDKSISAKRAAKAKGPFTICFKVDSIQEAEKKLEEMGCPVIERYDNGPIQEALMDTEKRFGFSMEVIEYPAGTMRQMLGMEEQ